ncbi:CvpA family protein [Phyllobacterium sp. A18/5-2]|uniref:CvpA family protein n=1 Tax=Phyllobacterium sp. A18/5-2 TaxID=2978392 RepID=UPI0021C6B186|nr:CvpA family protein [Phyllobacterium sp. A18/5-2]UXN64338.1 CvpA family protein [Phyllobacterium sp. A18/5-2]
MNAWLATIVGDTAAPIVGFVLLFILVIALLLIVFAILRRVTGGTFVAGGRNRQVRLSVTDAAAVDNRRRLVLVRRDDVEHLILIGGPSDLVIEQNIRQFAKQPSRAEPAAHAAPAEPEPRAASGTAETPRTQPAAPAVPAPRVAPPAPPTQRPAQPVQAAPAPQVPLRPAPPQPVSPPRDLRLAEPPKHAPAPVPYVTITPDPAPATAPAAEPPAVNAPARDNGNNWQRTASPSFGTAPRSEPAAETAVPERAAPAEARTTTAAAFPFAVRNEPTSSAYKEPSLEGPAETEEPEVTLGDLDFTDAFETDVESELHIAPGKDEKPAKADSIEDEMERLLGDLSKPEKR